VPRPAAGHVLALAEGKDEIAAMRFGSAVAGLKCSRLGGGAGMPTRAEVEAYLAETGAAAAAGAK
jgi:sulfofructose kinase